MKLVTLTFIISSTAWCQTPLNFKPATQQKLGVTYSDAEINPGAYMTSLDIVTSAPVINVPPAELTSNGQIDPEKRFMAFMIDIDVVKNGTGTTILHWFQPNLLPETTKTASLQDSNQNVNLRIADPNPGAIRIPDVPQQQTVYLNPAPTPGPSHRYVLVLFPQPQNFSVPACFSNIVTQPNADPQVDLEGRMGFDIAAFLAATGSSTLPIAGNFFVAMNPQPGPLQVDVGESSLRDNKCLPYSGNVEAVPAADGAISPKNGGVRRRGV